MIGDAERPVKRRSGRSCAGEAGSGDGSLPVGNAPVVDRDVVRYEHVQAVRRKAAFDLGEQQAVQKDATLERNRIDPLAAGDARHRVNQGLGDRPVYQECQALRVVALRHAVEQCDQKRRKVDDFRCFGRL